MRLKRIAAVAVIGALAMTGAACGKSDPSTPGAPVATATFAAGTTMAKLKEAQKITIGTKFDQPLFGQKGLDGKPAGFDVEIGKIIASELGIPADKITFIESTSKVREEHIEQRCALLLFGAHRRDERIAVDLRALRDELTDDVERAVPWLLGLLVAADRAGECEGVCGSVDDSRLQCSAARAIRVAEGGVAHE